MNILKTLIKRYRLVIILLGCMMLCVVGIVISTAVNQTSNENGITEELGHELVEKEEYSDVHYEEADDIKGYNYIINPWALNDKEIYVDQIQDISNEVNRVFKANGCEGKQLEILNVKKSGTKLKFKIKVVDEDIVKFGEYSLRYGTFEIKE